HRDRTVVDGQGEIVVVVDDRGDRGQLGTGIGELAARGQRLLNRGQIALEGSVHRRPPAAPAPAPDVSARTAAMASSMRSWWSADRISRPITPSASAACTMRSWMAWPSASALTLI